MNVGGKHKPTQQESLDRTHPLVQSAKYIFIPNAVGGNTNLVDDSVMTKYGTSTITLAQGVYGSGISIANPTPSGINDPSVAGYVFSNPIGVSLTGAVVARAMSVDVTQSFQAVFSHSDYTSGARLYFGFDGSQCSWRLGGSAAQLSGTVSSNTFHTIGISWDNGDATIWVDENQYTGTYTGTPGSVSENTSVGSFYRDAPQIITGLVGDIEYCYCFDRTINQSEYLSLMREPYQILDRGDEFIPTSSGAAGVSGTRRVSISRNEYSLLSDGTAPLIINTTGAQSKVAFASSKPAVTDDFHILHPCRKPFVWKRADISVWGLATTENTTITVTDGSNTTPGIFYATYTSSVDANKGGGNLVATLGRSGIEPTIDNERLDCSGASFHYAEYDGAGNIPLSSEMTYKWIYSTNNYAPAGGGCRMFEYWGSADGLTNSYWLYRRQYAGWPWRLEGFDKNGTAFSLDFGNSWVPVTDTEYEIELNIRWVSGDSEVRLFINGTQFGPTITTFEDIDAAPIKFVVGSDVTQSRQFYSDFIIFDSVQHTADYIPGYTLPE